MKIIPVINDANLEFVICFVFLQPEIFFRNETFKSCPKFVIDMGFKMVPKMCRKSNAYVSLFSDFVAGETKILFEQKLKQLAW